MGLRTELDKLAKYYIIKILLLSKSIQYKPLHISYKYLSIVEYMRLDILFYKTNKN